MARQKQKGSDELKTTSIQVNSAQWRQAKARAAEDGVTLTQVIRSLLSQWLQGDISVKKND